MTISRRLQAHRQAMASAGGSVVAANTANPDPELDPNETEPDDDEDDTSPKKATTKKETNMTDTVNANAVAEAVAAERTRTNTVLTSAEYIGREDLAATLLNTELSAEAITNALAKAPKPSAEAVFVGDADAAARAEMQSAIAQNRNSDIEPGAGDQQHRDNGIEAASVWDQAYALNNFTPAKAA